MGFGLSAVGIETGGSAQRSLQRVLEPRLARGFLSGPAPPKPAERPQISGVRGSRKGP